MDDICRISCSLDCMDLGDCASARHVRRQLIAILDRLETACREQDHTVDASRSNGQPESEVSGAEALTFPWPLQRIATE
eukprot:2202700-Alexandrium_andersonii.AAC.1